MESDTYNRGAWRRCARGLIEPSQFSPECIHKYTNENKTHLAYDGHFTLHWCVVPPLVVRTEEPRRRATLTPSWSLLLHCVSRRSQHYFIYTLWDKQGRRNRPFGADLD